MTRTTNKKDVLCPHPHVSCSPETGSKDRIPRYVRPLTIHQPPWSLYGAAVVVHCVYCLETWRTQVPSELTTHVLRTCHKPEESLVLSLLLLMEFSVEYYYLVFPHSPLC